MPPMNGSAAFEQPLRTAEKVLVVSIDDGLFGCHLGWVEAVYQGNAPRLHGVRTGTGVTRRFVLHQGDAAAVVDLRELLGLHELLGETRRSGYLLVRSGTALLALPIDACVGVRDIDLGGRAPIPTRVVRDGGVPLGHLLELDGRLLTVLDPSRLLDGELRDALMPLQARARAYQARQAKIDALWEGIRRDANPEQVRAFARLCRRSGRGRAAGAAQRVLQHMEHNGTAPDGDVVDAVDRLLCELVRRQRERSNGALHLEARDGAPGGAILLTDGQVINATCDGSVGRAAFARLLATGARATRFAEGAASSGPPRITDGTIALSIAALETLSGERLARAR
jgi:hypothetical protein